MVTPKKIFLSSFAAIAANYAYKKAVTQKLLSLCNRLFPLLR